MHSSQFAPIACSVTGASSRVWTSAALTALLMPDNAPKLRLVRAWLETWAGIGLVVAGMTHRGWDLQLTA